MMVPIDHHAFEVTFTRNTLCVELIDGRTVTAPLEWFPALKIAQPDRREAYRIDGAAIVWPALGERITTPFLLSLKGGASVAV